MTGKKKAQPPKEAGKAENRFSKAQLTAAERFRGRQDLLNALLSPDKTYTVGEAEEMIERFMKGKVR